MKELQRKCRRGLTVEKVDAAVVTYNLRIALDF